MTFLPALPTGTAMSVPTSRQRNRSSCQWICEYPPTISSLSSTSLAFTTKTTKGGVTSGQSSTFEDATVDVLNANKVKTKTLITSVIQSTEIIITKASGFTVDCDQDVVFSGKCDTNDKFFWNGDSSTMFIDGNIETREACITLNGSRLLTEEDDGKTIGIKFNYWDSVKEEQDIGWFGYDPVNGYFKYLLDVTIDTTTTENECYPCQILSGTPGDIYTDNFIAQSLLNKSDDGEDLNITSTTNIEVSATEGINLNSATFTMETTTGSIISNTGSSGIDILSSSGNIDIISTNSELNLKTNDDNMTINVDTGTMGICVESGDLNICVSSADFGENLNITTYNESCINIISNCDQAQGILIESATGGIDITANGDSGQDIDILNTASINITGEESDSKAVCLLAPNGGICIDAETNIDMDAENIIIDTTSNITTNVGGNLTTSVSGNSITNISGDSTIDINGNGTIEATEMTITVTDDFVINGAEKEDLKSWIPYKTFDVSTGLWQSFRDTTTDVSGCPVYYWRKVASAETSYLNIDIGNPFRTTTSKGFKLTGINVAYKIETTAITSIIPKLVKKTFTDGSVLTLSEIPITSGLETTVDEHYDTITIDSPSYLNTESVLNFELELITPSTSVFKFYGIMLSYTQDLI